MPDHANFELVGRPGLVLLHLQRGLAGEGLFIPNWGPNVRKDIDDSLMVQRCRELADAFRASGLPVIFVNAIPNPIGVVPAYGDLFHEIEAGSTIEPFFTDERIRRGLEVMPELGYIEGRDELLYSWLIGPFTNSGLDAVLKKHRVDTIVWGGFAQRSVCYTSILAAGDLWYNSVLPVDASVVVTPPTNPGYHPGLEDIVAEAVVRVLAPSVSKVTDTAAVLEKVGHVRAS